MHGRIEPKPDHPTRRSKPVLSALCSICRYEGHRPSSVEIAERLPIGRQTVFEHLNNLLSWGFVKHYDGTRAAWEPTTKGWKWWRRRQQSDRRYTRLDQSSPDRTLIER